MFITIDGDDVGADIDKFIFGNDIEGLKRYQESFESELSKIIEIFKKNKIEVLFVGGDSLIGYCTNKVDFINLYELLKNNDFSWSVGVGDSLEKAALALKKAKALGKCRVEFYVS